jgi:hypothetical protein
MYCKHCGHRSDEKTDTCTKCGVKLTSDVQLSNSPKRKLRWHVLVIAAVATIVVFVVLPRFLFKAEMESFGPTDKLRFLRALDRSQYKRFGQTGFRLEGQSLIVMWDLRWQALPEAKQLEIVRIEGKAWHVVGGDDTKFRIEGDDKIVAEYKDGQATLAQ